MNAIILAAGMGTRLRPLTENKPKCLVEVNGFPIVERQINCLHEIGVYDITLVSGYKAEALNHLKDKYGVSIVYNDKYDVYNNLYSMEPVLDIFGDTYVLEGDIYIDDNCLDCNPRSSCYFAVKKDYSDEWGLEVNPDMRLMQVNIGSGVGYIMSGISYWTKKDALLVKDEIARLISDKRYDLYWDNAVINILTNLNITVVPVTSIYEIDTVSDLAILENLLMERHNHK